MSNDRVARLVIAHHLRSLGVTEPVLVKRTPEGLVILDPALVRKIGDREQYTLVDCSENIDWLVDQCPGTVAIYRWLEARRKEPPC